MLEEVKNLINEYGQIFKVDKSNCSLIKNEIPFGIMDLVTILDLLDL